MTEFSDAAGELVDRCLFLINCLLAGTIMFQGGVIRWANDLVVRDLLV